MRLDRLAQRPVRAAARSSRSLLENELERAIDSAFAGSLPEAVGRSLADHHVLERVATEYLATAGADEDGADRVQQLTDRLLASEDVDRLAATLAEKVTQSPAFHQALKDVLASPEIRAALYEQSAGFGAEVAQGLRSRGFELDDKLEATAHNLFGRRPAEAPTRAFGGFASRGVALVVDAALAQLGFLVGLASIALVASLSGVGHPGWEAGVASFIGWLVVAACYFAGFWSSTGQTPGMRLLGLRVAGTDGGPISLPRALLRLLGLFLAIALLFLGFVPALFDGRRRALQDFMAGTVVVTDRAA